MKIIATNKKAHFEYFLQDFYQAGIVLVGSEVKSIRNGSVSINDSFVHISNGEAYLKNAFIKNYEKSSEFLPDEKRDRKLLLKKKEIIKLSQQVKVKGYSLIPTKIYFNASFAKLEFALAKGKKLYDKKQTIKERDIARSMKNEI
jgi:SsrA-binding protein